MSQPSHSDRFFSFWVAWTVGLLLIVSFEGVRWANPETRAESLSGWLCGREADWLPFLPIFLAGLVMWQVKSKASGEQGGANEQTGGDHAASLTLHSPLSTHLTNACLSLLLGALAIGVAAWTGWDMRDLPPAYHDEYSYLFQTLTFLDGRTWFPSFEAMPELFDQMHVLNEGRFASRYFPGAGVWLALFHPIGSIVGLWVAQGMVAIGASIVAGEIAGRSARVIAGLCVAFCPGLCLFSQLYLAHLPTLVGLSLFLVFILRLRRMCEYRGSHLFSDQQWRGFEIYCTSVLAGLGLAYAMLCRPMTSAGVGLPFGVWLFWWVGRRWTCQGALTPRPEGHDIPIAPPSTLHSPRSSLSPLLVVLSMGLPIAAGMAIDKDVNVQEVPYPELLKKLEAAKQIVRPDTWKRTPAQKKSPPKPPPKKKGSGKERGGRFCQRCFQTQHRSYPG